MDITVENIKCGGCAGTITKKLSSAFDTENIDVNIEQGRISIDIDDSRRGDLTQVLLDLGYPETDSQYMALTLPKQKPNHLFLVLLEKWISDY